MQAIAVFPHDRSIRLITHPQPVLTMPDQVMFRIRDVGICGTDRAICRFEEGSPPLDSDYLIIGHEAVGEVVAVGSDVHDLSPGDLVIATARRGCTDSNCRPCRTGHSDFCVTGGFIERGIKEAHGFMTEFVVEERRYLSVVPQALRDCAILIEPLAVVCKGFKQVAAVQRRQPWLPAPRMDGLPVGTGLRALVLGAGPIGLMGAALAVHLGYDTTVTSREGDDDPRAKVARAFGAAYTNTLTPAMPSFDVIIDATGAPSAITAALPALATNGIMVLLGIPASWRSPDCDLGNALRDLVLRNQALVGCIDADASWDDVVVHLAAIAASHPQGLQLIITSHVTAAEGVGLLRSGQGGIKDVIRF